MEILIIGVALAFNIIVILLKFKFNRKQDALIDAVLLTLVTIVFSGSEKALIIGTIGSALVSIYLLISPVKVVK